MTVKLAPISLILLLTLIIRCITLLDKQEGGLIYTQAASLASSILYCNGDLGGAGDGE